MILEIAHPNNLDAWKVVDEFDDDPLQHLEYPSFDVSVGILARCNTKTWVYGKCGWVDISYVSEFMNERVMSDSYDQHYGMNYCDYWTQCRDASPMMLSLMLVVPNEIWAKVFLQCASETLKHTQQDAEILSSFAVVESNLHNPEILAKESTKLNRFVYSEEMTISNRCIAMSLYHFTHVMLTHESNLTKLRCMQDSMRELYKSLSRTLFNDYERPREYLADFIRTKISFCDIAEHIQ